MRCKKRARKSLNGRKESELTIISYEMATEVEFLFTILPFDRTLGEELTAFSILNNLLPFFLSFQNSIRHNLSLHSRFVRVQNEGTGKSSWWMLNPDAKPGILFSMQIL
jgi:hypothetical protein